MPPRFTRAIVRVPGASLVRGLSNSGLGTPDYPAALRQHAAYVEALRACGLAVEVLPAEEEFPDSCFVEDVALCTPHCAVVTLPGAPSRRGEPALIRPSLWNHFSNLEEIRAPGTLDAGDVMMVGEHYYIGLSERTNALGAAQLIAILERYGMTGQTVPLRGLLHLKSGMAYLDNGNLLAAGEIFDDPVFEHFHRIAVPTAEAYAANSLWVNGRVLVPASCPATIAAIAQMGYEVIPLDMSEFEKLDGGLSCLSLRL